MNLGVSEDKISKHVDVEIDEEKVCGCSF